MLQQFGLKNLNKQMEQILTQLNLRTKVQENATLENTNK